MSKKRPEAPDRPPNPQPEPHEVRHTFDVAMAKVRERQGFYISLAVIIVLVAVAAIAVMNLQPSSENASDFEAVWKQATRIRQKLLVDTSAEDEIAELAHYLGEVRGTAAEAETLWLLGIYCYREAWTGEKLTAEDRRPHLEQAIGYLKELEDSRFDEFLLAKPRWFTEAGGVPVASLLKQVEEDLQWVNDNSYTEPLPNPSVVAVLRTSVGDIHLQFFSELAPGHVGNFVTLARKGTYNGTYFHAIRKVAGETNGVLAGDPLTYFFNDPLNKDHILKWGKGGLGYEIAPEPARNRVAHRRGIVTSEPRPMADWDNGSQFLVLTGTDIDLDKGSTPFARVVEGMGLVDKIAEKKTAGEHAPYKDAFDFASIAARDLLVEPVTIHKVVVYENGKALEHAFPLEDGEKSLATLSKTPVTPLTGDALAAGRQLRKIGAEGEIRPGLDIPFPEGVETAPTRVQR
jgi:peptidyl-prolyl cis-trans isomerase B (cyclophilin B)